MKNKLPFFDSHFFLQYKVYFAWISFTTLIFILTNAFSSLDFAYANRIGAIDFFLTYSFIVFIGFLEAAVISFFLILLKEFIQKILKVDLSSAIRFLLISGFGLGWVNLFLTIFKKSLF